MQTQNLTYERINKNLIRVNFTSNGKKSELVARVAQPGTYSVCLTNGDSENKKIKKEE